MGYMHIDNLYKNQDILAFRECYALEKVHGTSAHVAWRGGQLHFHPGGVKAAAFEALFDRDAMAEKFRALGHDAVTVYGEAYGGSCQGMSHIYGKNLAFIAFDVKIGETWVGVPSMEQIARSLGLDVVPFVKIPTTLEAIDAARDAPSEVAKARGMGDGKQREGVVLRPPFEVRKSNGDRVMAKHRIREFEERATPQKVTDPAKLAVLAEAEAIAAEWVTPMRLTHVLDKMPDVTSMKDTPRVIEAMREDVYREAKGEIVESKEAAQAIGKRAAALFRDRIEQIARASVGATA